MPSTSEIEDLQQPLDIDLSSSGAILIDIRRRFKDVTNVAKRVAVSGVEAIRPSGHQSSSARARRASTPGVRDEADLVENSTDAWAREGRLVSPSVASRQNSASHAGHREEEHSDEEDEDNAASRYTFFPHRQRSGSRGGESEGSQGDRTGS